MSLVDKLEGVHIGDILKLSNTEDVSVVGYVQTYTPESVKLSHEDPKAYQRWKESSPEKFRDCFPTRGLKTFDGDRTYKLKHFDSYEVLTPKQE